MTDPHVAAERERFETWATKWYMRRPGSFVGEYIDGDWVYHQERIQHAWAGWRGSGAAFEAGRRSGEQIVVTQIEQSTGPTGGWLDSPKAICAAIVQALKGKP